MMIHFSANFISDSVCRGIRMRYCVLWIQFVLSEYGLNDARAFGGERYVTIGVDDLGSACTENCEKLLQ